MNKASSFQGLGKVYKFTLYQLYRNKSNILSFGIFIAIALFGLPIASLFLGGDSASTSEALSGGFFTSVTTMEDFLGRDEIGYEPRYFVQYVYSILVMIICVFSCTFIVRAIIEEKSSKLVETLLVSIKSEAMILGKVLAIITFVSSMILLIIGAFGLSYVLTGIIGDATFVTDTLTGMGVTKDILNIGPSTLIIVIISMVLACLLLSLIAALSGAGCSGMEDMEAANTTATMIIMFSYLVVVGVAPFGSGPALFMSLCPFLSAFAAPTYFAIGDIGFGIMGLSWIIQIGCILLIHRLSGRVYDSLIMYKGSRLKLRQILAMALKKPALATSSEKEGE